MSADIGQFLTPEEAEVLEKIRARGFSSGEAAFLQSVFERLYGSLTARFERVDLDLAFFLLETADAPLQSISGVFWMEDELSPVGEAFFSWAEDRSLNLAGRLSAGDWEKWLCNEAFWRTLAVESQLPIKPAEEAEEAATESVEPVEEAAAEFENTTFEPDKHVAVVVVMPDEEDVVVEAAEPVEAVVAEFLGPAESPEDEAPDSAEPELQTDRAEPPDLADRDTLALGVAARQAVAKAELEAVRLERIQAILKTSLETAPPLLPLGASQIVEIEPADEPMAEPAQTLARPDRRTVLFSSARSRSEAGTEDQDGEELSFSQAPLSPFEKKNQLVIKNKFLGYGKNREGVIGLCGQLKISLFHPEELRGKLESSNPLLFLSPVQLSGTSTTVTYWLPPVAFPHPAGQLYIRESRDSKTLVLHSLFPKSRTDYLRGRQVLTALFAPPVLGCLYFFLVYYITVHGIDREAQELFPELYEAALEGVKSVDFRTGGLGLYRLKVIPASESLQMIWAGVLFLGPLLSGKFFHYLSRSRKRRLGGPLAGALLMPSILLLTAWNFQSSVLPLHDHKDFAPLALQGLLQWSLPLNVFMAIYLFLSNFGYWDRWIRPREVRLAMPVVLTLVYLVVTFLLIYGRSWMS